MSLNALQVKTLLTESASRYLSPKEAALFADLYLHAHMRKFPRMNPLNEAIEDLKVWRNHESRTYTTVRDNKSVLILDMNGLAPSLKIGEIHDQLESRAKQYGMGAVGIKNSSGIITLNMWADGLAKRDLIGLAMFNGGTECCVPFGARHGVLGTNPLAYAIPTLTDPVSMDMATSQIPFFELNNAKTAKSPVRANSVVDQQGLPTTDAAQALNEKGIANILPMGGGIKGYGIVMLIEILTGALIQSMLSTEQSSGWNPPEYGCLLLALDIASFTDPNRFKREVSAMCEEIRKLEPAQGYEDVSIPGDRGHAAARKMIEEDEIPLPDSFQEKLAQLNPEL